MLRLTEIKLPLGHPDGDIKTAILKRLGIAGDDLLGYVVFKRGIDARKPNAILFTYTLDITVRARHDEVKPSGAGVPASHLHFNTTWGIETWPSSFLTPRRYIISF